MVDRANILTPADEAALAGQAEELENATGHQFVVVTLTGLGGHKIEDYGMKLGNHWGIGRKEHDDGVLLIVAPNDRKVRIAVGLGLEKVITNAEAKTIIVNDILPEFREGRFPEGIRNGATSIVRELTPISKDTA